MAMTIIDNFSLQGKKFMDGRMAAATIAELKAMDENTLPDGFRSYCAEAGAWYQYNASNTEDASTGRWRVAAAASSGDGDLANAEAITDTEIAGLFS